jgi:FAD/FMN-containing dehydrogenase
MSTPSLDTVAARLDRLASTIGGELVRPGDDAYDEARSVWNGMIDLRPAAVVRCASAGDVAAAIRAAREARLPIAVRGGGHNVAGLATVDDGIVIDLSPLRAVTVDPERRLVTAGGGALLGDVDAASQQHGLAVPAGVVSTTGVAGLTLSGGMGWLRRAYGLTCDNLVAAELVTADGDVLHVDEESDPELLWGLRGGGGNFGVVTEFTFQAHPVGPEVAFLFCLYPIEAAHEVLEAHDRIVLGDDRLSTLAVLGHVPPLEDFAEEIHEAPYVALVGMFAGDAAAGEQAIAPLRSIAPVLADLSGVMPYVEAQQAYDPDYPAGHRYYWKSTNVGALPTAAVDALVGHALVAPSKHSTIDVWLNGGAIERIGEDETAFRGRGNRYLVNPEANWESAADDEANVAWARECLELLAPHASGGAYLNFPGFLEEGQGLVRASLGDNYARLAELKRRLDPENVFRRNANVEPAAA